MDITNLFYTGQAFIGYGTQWLIGQNDITPGPETFVAVADVESISLGEMTAGVVNKTHLRSPGRAHEKIATIRDMGPFTMTGNLRIVHGSQSNAGGDGFIAGGLIAIHRNLEERNMQISLSDSPNTVLPFRGVVSSLKLGDVTLDAPVKFTAVVQPLADYTASLP